MRDLRPFTKRAAAVAALGCITFSASDATARSAKRLAGEDYLAAFARVTGTKDGHRLRPKPVPEAERGTANAWQLQVRVERLALREIAPWPSLSSLSAQYARVRDTRFLKEGALPLRRIPWLYPDDGCYARAQLALAKLADKALPSHKLFVFGNLSAKTKNSPEGVVRWWYHVAPVVRVADRVYVIDPSLDPNRPLPLDQWLKAIGGVKTAALCKASAFLPEVGACLSAGPGDTANATYITELRLLSAERERIQSLGRNAERELGERPPWRVRR